MRLLPREEKFYHLFLKQVELISEASQAAAGCGRRPETRAWRRRRRDQRLEHAGDEIIHEIFTRLNQTFITPIDPEDIHTLSSALDDVLDGIEDTAHRMVAYQHRSRSRPTWSTLAEIVDACAKSLQDAPSRRWKSNGPLMEHCIEINRLENEADRIGRSAVVELFDKEKDPITLIKLKEVYEFFENTIDSCEDVADVLQNVVVKNS